MAYTVQALWSRVNRTRDVVLVDQRGTGQSNPLTCVCPTARVSTPAQLRAYVRSCLRAAPGDMRHYGTRAAAEDLEAVRVALGYRQLDVYGTSYGATLAQAYVRRYPDSVRTLVLDGGTRIDVPFYGRFAANAQHALDQVAKRCAADAACSKAFPTWHAEFSRLVRAWNAQPVHNRKNETTTGTGLAGVVQNMLLDASSAASIPLLVSRAARGDYGPLNLHISNGDPQLQLMFWSIWCNEPWVGLGARGPWHTDFDGYAAVSVADHRRTCGFLPKRAEPASAWTLPRSRVPLLALVGGADPQDPIMNLPRLKRTFPDSRAVVVPGLGHAIGQYGCLRDLVAVVVARGTTKELDTHCVRAIAPPPFILR